MLPSQGTPLTLPEFQHAFLPLVGGVVIAIILSLFLRETGLSGSVPKILNTKVLVPKAA